MSVSLYEQAVRSAQREIERQRKKQTDETNAANKADAAALRYERWLLHKPVRKPGRQLIVG